MKGDGIQTGVGDYDSLEKLVKDLPAVEQWISHVIQDIHLGCQNVVGDWHKKAKQWWSQYTADKGAPRREAYDGDAELYPNITSSIIDTAVAEYANGIFPQNQDFFSLRPKDPGSKNHVEPVKKTVQHFLDLMGFRVTAIDWLKHTAITGTGIVEVGWDYEDALVEDREKGEDGQTKIRRKRIITRDQPALDLVLLEDFFVPDIDVASIDDVDFYGKKFGRTRRRIYVDRYRRVVDEETDEETDRGFYRNLKYLPKRRGWDLGSVEPSNFDDTSESYVRGELPATQNIPCLEYVFSDIEALFDGEKAPDDWREHLKKFWGFSEAELEGGVIVTVADERIPIRIEPMADPSGKLSSQCTLEPFKTRKRCLFGIGLAEMMRDEQIELGAIRNQVLDWIGKQLRLKTYYDEDLRVNPDDIQKRTHDQYVPVRGTGGAVSLRDRFWREDVPPVPSDAYTYAGLLRSDVEERSGVMAIKMGRPGPSRMTATEASQLGQNVDLRFLQAIRLFEWRSLSRVLENIYLWVRRRTDQFVYIEVSGEEGADVEKVDADQLWGNFRWLCHGARETTNRFVRTQQMTIFAQNPVMAPVLNLAEHARRFYTDLGVSNVDELVIDKDKPWKMRPISEQWRIFEQGQPVKVTGRETGDEHTEAIEMHKQFLGLRVPEMAKAGESQARIERVVRVVEQNIADHEHFLRLKAEEEEALMKMAALSQVGKGGGDGANPGGLPPPAGNEMDAKAGAGQQPGPFPNTEGA